jgi:uncharacterized protein with NAD-binding domain and iron-sulfur cluster
MRRKRVVILGGGVAGMTAAHELIERGFDVAVYERRGIPGGKARSVPVPRSGKDGRKDLPGEHGFRFFPGFYRHLPDTLKRIPYPGNRHGVFDNLVGVKRELMGMPGGKPVIMVPQFPKSLAELKLLLKTPVEIHQLGITDADLDFFATRLWQILTSCWERRVQEYDRIGWWNFVDAASRSKTYQEFLAIGLTRTLVACKAESASTKTIGDIGAQLIFNMMTPGENSDRVLNGPTNDVWIGPWLKYLQDKGVLYQFDSPLESIAMANGRVQSVTVHAPGGSQVMQADYYIAAVPVEVMAKYLTPDMLAADPTLGGIQQLTTSIAWMNGIQFYLREDVPIVYGHEMFLNTPWSLTSISQAQFWPAFKLAEYGDGQVRGILSVDVSEWEQPGMLYGKPAKDCTPDEIAKEVWAQLKSCLNTGDTQLLDDKNLHSWFLDPDIQDRDNNPSQHTNAEPLLVNTVQTWSLRPAAYTQIPNFFLASDYVRTNTDLATMEGANEAARRAVNAILDQDGSSASHCRIWNLHEPVVLGAWRGYDHHRFRKGLPWNEHPPHPILIWIRGAVTAFADTMSGMFESVRKGILP